NNVLNDSINYHQTLKHGADVKEEYLNRFGFQSLKDFDRWSKEPIKGGDPPQTNFFLDFS
uniref:Uncharacterized protein n=1 Tax=Panagrolaimus sp. ES5 TaxID=591445 RepID=A0AC34GB85_9BILA